MPPGPEPAEREGMLFDMVQQRDAPAVPSPHSPSNGEKARMRGLGGAFAPLAQNFSPLSIHPPPERAYTPPSLPSRGRARDRLGRVGRERRPRRSGPARHSRLRGERSRSSRGSPSPPLRHYDRSAFGLKKRGMETFRRRDGSAGEAHSFTAAPAGAPATPRCLRGAKLAERSGMPFDKVQSVGWV